MASISRLYTFSANTDIRAAEVNAELNQVISFLNNSVVHKDALVSATYAPQIDQGATTNIGKTTNEATYIRIENLVWVSLELTLVGAGTAGSAVSVSLPLAPAGAAIARNLGQGQIFDTSTGTRYVCSAEQSGTNKVVFVHDTSSNQQFGVSPAIALASGDAIRANLVYRVA